MLKVVRLLFKRSRGLVIFGVLISIFGGAINSAMMAVIHQALTDNPVSVKLLMLSFAAICLVVAVTRVVSDVALTHLAQKTVFELRMDFARQILQAPLRRAEQIGGPRLWANLTADVGAISGALTQIPLLCTHLTIIAGCLAYLTWLSWRAALSTTFFIVVAICTYKLAESWGVKYLRESRELADKIFRHFHSLTEGLKELKLHRKRREVFLSDSLSRDSIAMNRKGLIGTGIYSFASSWAQLMLMGLVGVLVFAPSFSTITKETAMGYAMVLFFMIGPLNIAVGSIGTMSRARIALDKVKEVGLDLSVDFEQEPEFLESYANWSRLEIVDATHTYLREEDNSRFTLGPINARFDSGELIFIAGGNGSGKTTLAKILTGLYIPESGMIRLDGQPIEDENRASYRELFSVVFWDFYLFDSLLGLDSPELDAHVDEYLIRLKLENKVEVKDGKLSTTALSTGQRKRLALLTAYLEDRPIYVFDEWAADQDPQFKEIFYHQLLPELKAKGKTVFVISHDDRYYDVADRVVKLADGGIVGASHVSPQ